MDDVERAAHFFKLIEEKKFYELAKLLDDDFKYFGPLPDPFSKEIWLAFQRAIQQAFPDWSYNLKKVEKGDDTVEVTVEITGTHKHALSLPLPGVNPIPATAKEIHLPEERATLKFRGDKLYELHVQSTPHGGLPGLLEQLGVE